MGSLVCSECGYLRWTPSTSCPSCGAQPVQTSDNRTIVRPSDEPVAEAVAWFDGTPGHEPPRAPRIRSTRARRKALEVLVATSLLVAIVIAFLYVTNPTTLGLSGSSPSPIILFPNGTAWPPVSGGLSATYGFDVPQHGILQGSFLSPNQPIEVCVTNYFLLIQTSAQPGGPTSCPSNASYSTGTFASSGQVRVAVDTGRWWLSAFAPRGQSGDIPVWHVNWDTTLEIAFH